MTAPPRTVRLSRSLRPTWIEPGRPGLYRLDDGEVFEIDEEAWTTLALVHAGLPPPPEAGDLVRAARETQILVRAEKGHASFPALPPPAPPYLRHLNLQVTHRCHLRCAHCYHGAALEVGVSLPTALVLAAVADFAELGGLACTLTGGEPSLHPGFWELNEAIPDFGVRVELFTNGLGVSGGRVPELRCHRVRVSLDGMEEGHERIRGRGTFAPTVRFARAVREAGFELAVSTELHAGNLGEIDRLQALVRDELGASAWRVGAPFLAGRWREAAPRLAIPWEDARSLASRLGYGRRGFVSDAPVACDAEMLTIDADGAVGSCAMLGESFSWSLHETPLREIWRARVGALGGVRVGDLSCRARCAEREHPVAV